MSDQEHMHAATALARRGLGSTWPNPSVGCVLVRDGRVVGRGVTAVGGRPHAETVALAMAGETARGATAYVTLEPCSHHGVTPPCADALIAAGVVRVVVACGDPDPRVDGRGLARLRDAGIAVQTGVLASEAAEGLAGFFSRVRRGRPLVTLKLATTLDGRIATATGESRWITGPAARRWTHALRARHDAILVGIGTVLADDPDLTCRIEGYARRQPVRIVLDSRLRTPATARVLGPSAPTWLVHAAGSKAALPANLIEAGSDLAATLQALGAAGLTSILVEGGAAVAGSFLRAGLVDRIAWFHAPAIMGEGFPAIRGFDPGALAAMPRYIRTGTTPMGDDMLTEFRAA